MAFCAKCGIEAPAGANFCAKCGAGLGGSAVGNAPVLAAGVAGGGPTPPEDVIFEGSPSVLASVGDLLLCLVTLGLYALYRWLHCLSSRFRITTQRLEFELGIFSKRRDVLWLYRVEDLDLEQPFLQRLMGTGNIEVISSDKTTPDLHLNGLAGASQVYDRLKAAVERERMRRQVRTIDVQQ
ncbi:MAG: PH domain-containing protein [Planctomycetes bacterium]|nr:PH domain-containing protein [Planctomycetota bacterium]